MNRYVMRFTIANILFTAGFAVVAALLQLKSGSGLAIGAAFASGIIAASAFVRDYGRMPTHAEKKAFAWRALLCTWLVSLVLVLIVCAFVLGPSDLPALARAVKSGTVWMFATGAVAVVSLIYYIAIRWSFGWYAKVALNKRT